MIFLKSVLRYRRQKKELITQNLMGCFGRVKKMKKIIWIEKHEAGEDLSKVRADACDRSEK